MSASSRPTSLESLRGSYGTLLKWYMGASVAGVALFLLTSDQPAAANLGIVAASVVGALFMFWGSFVMIGLQIKLHGHTPLIGSAVHFFFWFFLVGLLLAAIQGSRGVALWPFMLLVAPAVSLGVLKAWAQVKSKTHPARQVVHGAGDRNEGRSG